ncbi:MAG: squalene/phytoene synthase family protein [Candidatus Thiosymbion ectosymbiont of Robbea hypermnestra]|nr:squalene/phytoene synthase family protein [Candidatus Thiosymbion ectosymbiont of Robbea hypermnestra]
MAAKAAGWTSDAWRFPNRATPLGSSTYYSLRFAPRALRDDLAVLAAWRYQLREIPDRVSEPDVARRKLLWWHDELERTFTGTPRHPLSLALQPVVARHGLPRAPFDDMAGQVAAEILRRQFGTEAELDAACERDLGALFELIARCHGQSAADALGAARRLGGLCAHIYRLRDGGLLARRGRALLPEEPLRARGLSSAALARREHRGQLPELLAPMADRARARIADPHGQRGLPLCIRVGVRLAASLLDELRDSGYEVADRRIALTPLRKLWLAWRESRRPP